MSDDRHDHVDQASFNEDAFFQTLHNGPVQDRRSFVRSRKKIIHQNLFAAALRSSTFFVPVAVVGATMVISTPADALPLQGTVQGGSANIVQTSSARLDIVQTSTKAVIDWKAFSIGADEHVHFDHQAGADSITLNRVTGDNASVIAGQLTATGNVWLINPNGVMFSNTAQVDVGGLLATTSDITNADFMAGEYNFFDTGSDGTIINDGNITIQDGGLAAFVAPGVENNGIITANLGKVALAGGHTYTVDLYGDGLIQLGTDTPLTQIGVNGGEALDHIVSNSGSIIADGGQVHITTQTAQNLVDTVINMSGIIQANSVDTQNGEIIIHGGDHGINSVTGTVHAQGNDAGEVGGEIQILGDLVAVHGGAEVDASGHAGGGEIYIGGDYRGLGDLKTAEKTRVLDATLKANALTNGDGGKVIVWADHDTVFDGTIRADAGEYGGDGGFVEVSGKHYLSLPSMDISAKSPLGEAGTILFDPDNIVIEDGGGDTFAFIGDGNTTVLFGEEAFTDLSIDASEIIAVLNAGTSVTLQANNNITVDEEIVALNAAGGSLVLTANDDIFINQQINIGGGATFTAQDNMTINADVRINNNNDGSNLVLFGSAGAANITINDGVTISTGLGQTGNVTISANAGAGSIDINGNVIIESGTGAINFLSEVDLNSGDLTLRTNNLTFGLDVVSSDNAGNLTLSGGATGASISLADSAGGASDLNITMDNHLDRVQSSVGSVQIGEATSGDITVLNTTYDRGTDIGFVNGGANSINLSGTLDLNNVAGQSVAFTSGSGGIDVNRSLLTDGGDITFNSAATILGGPQSLNTGAGGGDISLSDINASGLDLTLNSGTGNIRFGGDVTNVDDLNVTQAGTITQNSSASVNVTNYTVTDANAVHFGLSGVTASGSLTVQAAAVTGRVQALAMSFLKSASLDLTGAITGFASPGTQAEANQITLLGSGPQNTTSFFNGFYIGGTTAQLAANGTTIATSDQLFNLTSSTVGFSQLTSDEIVPSRGHANTHKTAISQEDINPQTPSGQAFNQMRSAENAAPSMFLEAGRGLINILKGDDPIQPDLSINVQDATQDITLGIEKSDEKPTQMATLDSRQS